jgi:hypothetical protein
VVRVASTPSKKAHLHRIALHKCTCSCTHFSQHTSHFSHYRAPSHLHSQFNLVCMQKRNKRAHTLAHTNTLFPAPSFPTYNRHTLLTNGTHIGVAQSQIQAGCTDATQTPDNTHTEVLTNCPFRFLRTQKCPMRHRGSQLHTRGATCSAAESSSYRRISKLLPTTRLLGKHRDKHQHCHR